MTEDLQEIDHGSWAIVFKVVFLWAKSWVRILDK